MMIQLKNGEYTYIRNQRDVVDIARELCGDDYANLLERINWDNNYRMIAESEDELCTAFSNIRKSYDVLINMQLSGLCGMLKKLRYSAIEDEEVKATIDEFLVDSEKLKEEYLQQLERICKSVEGYEGCIWDMDLIPDVDTLYE